MVSNAGLGPLSRDAIITMDGVKYTLKAGETALLTISEAKPKEIDIDRLRVDREYWDSVAPKHATHYDPHVNAKDVWVHESVDCIYQAWSPESQSWIPDFSNDKYKGQYIPRPPAKEVERLGEDGELPPIGEFAYCLTSQTDERILAHDTISNPNMAIVCDNSGYWGAEAHHWAPIKTQEQKEREDLINLIKSCDEMASSFRPDDIADAVIRFYRERYNLEP